MARKKYKRGLRIERHANGYWYITGTLYGTRLRESTGARDADQAQEILAARIREITARALGRGRHRYTWQEAVIKYFDGEIKKKSIEEDRRYCRKLGPYLAGLFLDEIKMKTLQPYIDDELAPRIDAEGNETPGNTPSTVNHALQVVRRILGLAGGIWENHHGDPWIDRVPPITFIKNKSKRAPRPLTYEEQDLILSLLPDYMRAPLLFKANTGTREQEVVGLRWSWLKTIPETDIEIFLIPDDRVKNAEPRIVLLNSICRAIIQTQRGENRDFVFPGPNGRMERLNTTSFRTARKNANLPDVRVHDFKHTLGARLRAVGVPEEDRKFLLGHKGGHSMTTHYSTPELFRMLDYLEQVVDPIKLTLVRKNSIA